MRLCLFHLHQQNEVRALSVGSHTTKLNENTGFGATSLSRKLAMLSSDHQIGPQD